MYLKQLKLSALRNLKPVVLEFSSNFNLIYGENGSGKTSLLETIYLLATGRSFRTRHAVEFIQQKELACIASGLVFSKKQVHSTRLGVERHLTHGLRLRMNEEPFNTLSEWVKVLPLQLINVDGYQLLSGSPQQRRQFLDWPVFHVEHSYYLMLQRYRRALKQRNAALRHPRRTGILEIESWNKELSEVGEEITRLRRAFLTSFFPIFNEYLALFLNLEGLALEFKPGWNEQVRLEDALSSSIDRDLALGYTSRGPHRADFGFIYQDTAIETLLSRGQLKLFISALFLARSVFVTEKIEHSPVCLLDDLCSELDINAAARLVNGLLKLNSQIFVTGIDKETILDILASSNHVNEREIKPNFKMFHVEQGEIKEMN